MSIVVAKGYLSLLLKTI